MSLYVICLRRMRSGTVLATGAVRASRRLPRRQRHRPHRTTYHHCVLPHAEALRRIEILWEGSCATCVRSTGSWPRESRHTRLPGRRPCHPPSSALPPSSLRWRWRRSSRETQNPRTPSASTKSSQPSEWVKSVSTFYWLSNCNNAYSFDCWRITQARYVP